MGISGLRKENMDQYLLSLDRYIELHERYQRESSDDAEENYEAGIVEGLKMAKEIYTQMALIVFK